MNRSLLAFVAGALLTTGVVQASNLNTTATVDTRAQAVGDKEQQPHMHAAIASLRTAKEQLQKATADKGGHRQKALDLVAQAIDAVQAGIAFDNSHPPQK